jgi:hypothetical protein
MKIKNIKDKEVLNLIKPFIDIYPRGKITPETSVTIKTVKNTNWKEVVFNV